MNAAKLLKGNRRFNGNDVGGATTDVHSLTEDSDEIAKILVARNQAKELWKVT